MSVQRISMAFLFVLAGLVIAPASADAQINKLKKAAEKELEKQVTKVAECTVDDTKCAEDAKKDGKTVVLVDPDGNPVEPADPDPAAADAPNEEPGEGVWRNYDFTPGATVWKATDFTDEPVGRFPASQLEFVKGNMEIVELDGVRVLETSSSGVFRVHLPDALPEDYTIEFQLQTGSANMITTVYIGSLETSQSRYEHQYLKIFHRAGIHFQGLAVSELGSLRQLSEQMMPVKFQVDGDYAILYVGSDRVANVPNANFPSADFVEFHVSGNRNLRSYISDIVVAVGLDDLYSALMETGEFTTRGILFDVDSDVLRPESTPVLEELRSTLDGHPELMVTIVGHTDSTGDDAHNLDLSQRRAQSVVDYLVQNGIDSGRMEADGRGETVPVADNETPEGRQANRRVVIQVKQ